MKKYLPQFAFVLWLLFVCWIATIYKLSSTPGNEINPWMFGIPFGDKLAHFAAFSAGAVLFFGALRLSSRLSPRTVIALTIAVVALYGALDEWHQLYTPNRSGADVWDWLADAIGAIAGAFMADAVFRSRRLADGAQPGAENFGCNKRGSR